MNVKRVMAFLAAIFCTIFLLRVFSNGRATGAGSTQAPRAATAPILDASVQISMSVSLNTAAEVGSGSEVNRDKVIANGIGSLIQDRGQVLLVTHNHWGPALQDLTLIEFRDAGNQLIARMFGYEFKEHVLFQDAGTLILRAPEQVLDPNPAGLARTASPDPLVPARAGHPDQAKPGQVVQIAYRGSGDRQRIGVLDAEVMAIDGFKGLAILQLRSLDGQPLRQGDSGGGVWFQGELVANTWTTLVTGPAGDNPASRGAAGDAGPVFTDFSFAAILPR